MKYDKCAGYEGFECPVVKTGTNRRRPRCNSCATKGRTHSSESKAKMSFAHTGKPCGPQSFEARRNKSIANGGDGDILNRRYPGLQRWTYLVKERDGYKCAECEFQGTKGKKDVDAHHVVPKAKFPELATVLLNGVTLCKPCHKEIHSVQS